jgi:Uma2 family endonuclease
MTDHLDRFGERYGEPPDMVVEVVSDDEASRVRDYEDTHHDYAAAGLPEYWIVDPGRRRVIAHVLGTAGYAVAGEDGPADVAPSGICPGFSVPVGPLFASASDSCG